MLEIFLIIFKNDITIQILLTGFESMSVYVCMCLCVCICMFMLCLLVCVDLWVCVSIDLNLDWYMHHNLTVVFMTTPQTTTFETANVTFIIVIIVYHRLLFIMITYIGERKGLSADDIYLSSSNWSFTTHLRLRSRHLN